MTNLQREAVNAADHLHELRRRMRTGEPIEPDLETHLEITERGLRRGLGDEEPVDVAVGVPCKTPGCGNSAGDSFGGNFCRECSTP